MDAVTYVLRDASLVDTHKGIGRRVYLDGRAFPHTHGIVKIGMCAAFLGVYPYEIELVPHPVDKTCQTAGYQL